MASAAAVEPRPAVPAVLLVVYMCSVECIIQSVFKRFILQISQPVICISYELMTRIDITLRRYSYIFCSGSAPGNTLDHTWSLIEIHIEVEEIKRLSFSGSLNVHIRKAIILFADRLKILIAKGVLVPAVGNNRLYGYV